MTQRLLIACAACGIALAQAPGGAPQGNDIAYGAPPGTGLPPSGKPLPKMSNGKPDLSGMWIFQPAKNGDNIGPYKAEILPKVRALAKDNSADPGVSCFLLGTPRVTTFGQFPFKIIQSPK